MNKKINQDILKECTAKKVDIRDRDKMVIECLLRMAADPKMNWTSLSTGDCCIRVDRDENGVISIHDYKPFRFGYSRL